MKELWWIAHPNPRYSRAHRMNAWCVLLKRTLCGLPIQRSWVELCPLRRDSCPDCERIAGPRGEE